MVTTTNSISMWGCPSGCALSVQNQLPAQDVLGSSCLKPRRPNPTWLQPAILAQARDFGSDLVRTQDLLSLWTSLDPL